MGHTGTAARVRPESQPPGLTPSGKWCPTHLPLPGGHCTGPEARPGQSPQTLLETAHTMPSALGTHTARRARPSLAPAAHRLPPQAALPALRLPPLSQPPGAQGQVRAGPPLPTPRPTTQTSAPGLSGPASCPARWRLGTAPSLPADEETEAGPRPPAPAPGVLGSGVSASTCLSPCLSSRCSSPSTGPFVGLTRTPRHSRCEQRFLLARLAGPPNPGGQASRLPGLRPRPGRPEACAPRGQCG